ncbi:FAD-dependent oxidoreductase [Nocardioides perillae]|uniref:Amine oxidase domain-containing protein n=1 Tax=Nocardioides perillae TaxID=1119534 RepID=A0A7Y9RTU3_9ACTN|nr:hypothetical protein [Nocardioides perillae]
MSTPADDRPTTAPRATAAPSADAPVVVVGAGLAGVACARAVAAAGHPVELVDRGRRIGGRMASRRFDGRPVDTGASYFTVSDPRFAAVVDRWEAAGLARPWTDTFHVLEAGAPPRLASGPVRWATPGGLRTLVEDLAAPFEVRQAEVERVDLAAADHGAHDGAGEGAAAGLLVDGRPASAVALAMPDEQARRLLGTGLAAEAEQLRRPSEPVLALVAWWPERCWGDDLLAATGRPLDGAFVNGDPDVAWIADDGRRRADDAPVLVAHTTPERAARHLADPASAGPAVLAALQRLLGIPDEPAGHHVHRWSLARPVGERDAAYLLSSRRLGVCGDGWGPVSKVEGAWLSGTALGEALVAALP